MGDFYGVLTTGQVALLQPKRLFDLFERSPPTRLTNCWYGIFDLPKRAVDYGSREIFIAFTNIYCGKFFAPGKRINVQSNEWILGSKTIHFQAFRVRVCLFFLLPQLLIELYFSDKLRFQILKS